MDGKTCLTCHWFSGDPENQFGWCHQQEQPTQITLTCDDWEPGKKEITMLEGKQCLNCKWREYKDSIGMFYCMRPKGYQLLTYIENGFVDQRDLPKDYELCGEDKKHWEPTGRRDPETGENPEDWEDAP